jgi:hypothetical protein
MGAISVLIGVLVIVVVGAICFWVIDRFAPGDARLKQLLKLLVVLVCLGAIVQRLFALTY